MDECSLISQRIAEIISLGDESDQQISSFEFIPGDFFEDMESSWKGRVKRMHAEEAFAEVERAGKALSIAVSFRTISPPDMFCYFSVNCLFILSCYSLLFFS